LLIEGSIRNKALFFNKFVPLYYSESVED